MQPMINSSLTAEYLMKFTETKSFSGKDPLQPALWEGTWKH